MNKCLVIVQLTHLIKGGSEKVESFHFRSSENSKPKYTKAFLRENLSLKFRQLLDL